MVSGSFGTNAHADAAADAALLSQAVGRPVRVQWSREDDLGWDPKGPPQVLDLRGALDTSGNILAWGDRRLAARQHAGPAGRAAAGAGSSGAGAAAGPVVRGEIQLNADPPYAIPHMRTVIRWLKDTPWRPAQLRAPGKIANSLAVECFTDELAAAARADPLHSGCAASPIPAPSRC